MNRLSTNTPIQKKEKKHSEEKPETLGFSRLDMEPFLNKAKSVLASLGFALGLKTFLLDAFIDKQYLDAVNESRKIKGTHIYKSAMGNIHWVCPIYKENIFAGVLLLGQVDSSKEMEKDEITAIGDLLRICAEDLSKATDPTDYVFRRVAQKEESKKSLHRYRDIGVIKAEQEKISLDSELLMEKERLLFAAIRRGDLDTGKKTIKEILNYLSMAFQGDIELTRYKAMELAVLLSRAVNEDSNSGNDHFYQNNKFFKKVKESQSIDEIYLNMQGITEGIAAKIFSFRGVRHSSVLRKAERFIWDNYTRKISLEEIAKASGLSAPYFSTVFKDEMGENLSSYLNRLRVEKAANILITANTPLYQIAEQCGFEDQSWFSKIFKKYTGTSPGKFRDKGNKNIIETRRESWQTQWN